MMWTCKGASSSSEIAMNAKIAWCISAKPASRRYVNAWLFDPTPILHTCPPHVPVSSRGAACVRNYALVTTNAEYPSQHGCEVNPYMNML
jgi:hypothetical protein